jgi:hypothetical protein
MPTWIQITKTALKKFESRSPSESDWKSLEEELERVLADPDRGKKIPFSVEWGECKVTWAEADKKWYVVYQKSNPNIIVLLIDEAK